MCLKANAPSRCRNLGHARLKARGVDLIQWLREATRPRLVMYDDVAAKAMSQKTEGGHAGREEGCWGVKDATRPKCAGKPFQRNAVIFTPNLHWHF